MPRRRGSSSGLFLTLHTCLTAWCISLLPPAAASVYRLKKFLFPQVPFPIESRHFSLPGPFSSTVVASFWAQAAPLGWQLLFPLSSPLPPHGSGSCPHTCSHTHARARAAQGRAHSALSQMSLPLGMSLSFIYNKFSPPPYLGAVMFFPSPPFILC